MTSINITAPTTGTVTIELNWESASALTRVLGKVNSGSSKKAGLHTIYEALEEHFGNDNHAKGVWKSAIVNSLGFPQIYLEKDAI